MDRSIKLWINNEHEDLKLKVRADKSPLTPEFLDRYFRRCTVNSGNLPCWRLGITTLHHNFTLMISEWIKPTAESEPQLWQVWVENKFHFDLCRIETVEHLLGLMYGMNLQEITKN